MENACLCYLGKPLMATYTTNDIVKINKAIVGNLINEYDIDLSDLI